MKKKNKQWKKAKKIQLDLKKWIYRSKRNKKRIKIKNRKK